MDYQPLLRQITSYTSPIEIAVQGRSTMVSPIEMIAQGGIEYSPPTPDKVCKHTNNCYPPVKPYIPPHGSIKPQVTKIYKGSQRHEHLQRKKPNKGLVSIRHDRLRKTKIGFTKYSSVF